MSRRVPLHEILAAALVAAACHTDDPTSPTSAERSGEPQAAAREVARVDVARGHTITFLDLGDGGIAITELAREQDQFVSPALIERQQASALEVYLALHPAGTVAPARLVRDHERVAMVRRTGPAPRLLANPSSGQSPFTDPGHGSYTCDHFGTQWVADWKAAFVGVTKYREAKYHHNYSPAWKFYPGAAVYHGTNTNSKTYLGACNGDDEHELRFEIHRWIGGKWTRILTAGLAGGSKYTFYSGVPARYRGKTYGHNRETVEHYGVGAAWTLSPGSFTP
jgi:hypothetical protein